MLRAEAVASSSTMRAALLLFLFFYLVSYVGNSFAADNFSAQKQTERGAVPTPVTSQASSSIGRDERGRRPALEGVRGGVHTHRQTTRGDPSSGTERAEELGMANVESPITRIMREPYAQQTHGGDIPFPPDTAKIADPKKGKGTKYSAVPIPIVRRSQSWDPKVQHFMGFPERKTRAAGSLPSYPTPAARQRLTFAEATMPAIPQSVPFSLHSREHFPSLAEAKAFTTSSGTPQVHPSITTGHTPSSGTTSQIPSFHAAMQQPSFDTTSQQPSSHTAMQQPSFHTAMQHPSFGITRQQFSSQGAMQHPPFVTTSQQSSFHAPMQCHPFGTTSQQFVPYAAMQKPSVGTTSQQFSSQGAMQKPSVDTTSQQFVPHGAMQQPSVGTTSQQFSSQGAMQKSSVGTTSQQFVPHGAMQQPSVGTTSQQFVPYGAMQKPSVDTTSQQFVPYGAMQKPSVGTTSQQFVPYGAMRHPSFDTTLQQFPSHDAMQRPSVASTWQQTSVHTPMQRPSLRAARRQPGPGYSGSFPSLVEEPSTQSASSLPDSASDKGTGPLAAGSQAAGTVLMKAEPYEIIDTWHPWGNLTWQATPVEIMALEEMLREDKKKKAQTSRSDFNTRERRD